MTLQLVGCTESLTLVKGIRWGCHSVERLLLMVVSVDWLRLKMREMWRLWVILETLIIHRRARRMVIHLRLMGIVDMRVWQWHGKAQIVWLFWIHRLVDTSANAIVPVHHTVGRLLMMLAIILRRTLAVSIHGVCRRGPRLSARRMVRMVVGRLQRWIGPSYILDAADVLGIVI